MADKTSKKEGSNRVIPLRQAGKTVSDNFDRPSKLLFDEVLKHEQNEIDETQATQATSPTSPTSPAIEVKQKVNKSVGVSPEKDFQKVANSIVREIVPSGIFIGKSKLIYDCLYLLTRGAINPTRSVRVTKRVLMSKAGIGSERTLLKNLTHLKSHGLIKITEYEGQHEGNEYEVFLPEELLNSSTQSTIPTPRTPHHAEQSLQKVGTLPPAQNEVRTVGLNVDTKTTYEDSKTIFKDLKYIDDESKIIEIIVLLNEAAKRATGKDLTTKDFDGLKEIIEIVISETDTARTRTQSVSVYMKLAAENLRRRLYVKKTGIKPKTITNNNNWSEIGKNQSEADEYDEQGNYIPKSLDERGREEALQILRDYQSWDAPIKDSQRFYTEEDWIWLMENLTENN